MSTLDGSVTTIPAESTQDGQKPRGSLAICSVFPLVPERIAEVKPGRSVLGRAEDCAMRLSGGEISRTHAELLRGHEGARRRFGFAARKLTSNLS